MIDLEASYLWALQIHPTETRENYWLYNKHNAWLYPMKSRGGKHEDFHLS